ncbi:aminotransferase class V-fold PLP-dependent enzyme [Rouxiella badensis]|uniref:pyridoxal-phosphate-dependent aminotransferase family protein n=1 Tax=Rouxiella badensis TaxID=1646377 RepID=UPI001D14CF68|nr:aminotransferase class V-fold PLP-dependent enzyme [Rouxiella badensis]MCC3701627.1 aminotransferase class V-fold PLP-dependent enzyme [Rouxiella badensis]
MIPANTFPALGNSFFPQETLLMGAGPVPQPPSVKQANTHIASHLGQRMNEVVEQLKAMARYAFQTTTPWVFGLSGPGSAAAEMAIGNLVHRRSRVLAISSGHFGLRMCEMARRHQAKVVLFEFDGREAFPLDRLRALLEQQVFDVVTLVHGETSSTTLNPDLPEIAALCKKQRALVVVDTVCTLGTTEVLMDNWQLDVVFCGGQKGLSSIPGVSLIAFSNEAWERVVQRTFTPTQWCYDALLAKEFWHHHRYHYTAPVNGIFALHEALRLLNEETLPLRIQRHRQSSQGVQKVLLQFGLTLAAPLPTRLDAVVGFQLPVWLSSVAFIDHLLSQHQVEISASFGSPLLRIGQMGEQCRAANVLRLVTALGESLDALGHPVDLVGALKTVSAQYGHRELLQYD